MFNLGLLQFSGQGGTPLTNTYSCELDGVDEYIDYGNVFGFDTNEAFSISIWVKPTTMSAQKGIFAKNTIDTSVFGYMLYHNSLGQLFLQARAPSQLRSHTFSTLTLTAGAWQLVTLTYDGSQNINGFRAYINNTVGTTPSSASLTNSWVSTYSFRVGNRSNSFSFSGKVDEMGVWNKALSSSEVNDLYNGGTPISLTSHSAAANLVCWTRFGDGDTFPSLTDNSTNSFTGTMTNMESGDIQTDVP